MSLYRKQRVLRAFARVLGALGVLVLSASATLPLQAQTHKVSKPENVVRAVAVYEWTGDMAKPTASRLVPVSLFIDGRLEDAGVYLARPVPFALDAGNVYEIDRAGIALGTLDLLFARHLIEPDQASTDYDDGWFGYGKFIPPTAPERSTLKPSRTLAAINGLDDDDDRPHFSARSATPGSGGAATPAPGTSTDSSETPADDPDRPILHRSPSGQSSPSETPADDPDRPTLHRSSSDGAQNAQAEQPGGSDDDPLLNDDPNRPILHRGKPAGDLTGAEIPKLAGLPGEQDLHQRVAVSDAVDRPPHDFSRAWESEAEHQAILAGMRTTARTLLAAYTAANAPNAANAVAPANAPAAASQTRAPDGEPWLGGVQEISSPLPEPLLDEQLKGYTLSYGGPPTYVYSAHTGGLGPALCYITLVAQVDMLGKPEMAIESVTDADHLDRTPRMKLIDAVDAEASNRASLLFELRAQNSRQFALYRVYGARADQIFLTGNSP